MSTPPVSTKPDVRIPGSEPERRAIEAPARPPVEPEPTDRAVPADLLLDVPQLTVEELTLELDASLLLDSVKLDAKGLDASLYLKADFERLQALARKDPGAMEGRAQDSQRRRVTPGVRMGLADTLRRRRERRHDGNGDRRQAGGERGRHAAMQGMMAAGLTAAGLAGGAVLESQFKPAQKLPIPHRRNRAQAMLESVTKRLP